MNKPTIALLAVTICALPLRAQTPPTPPPPAPSTPSYTVTVTAAAVSQYMWRGLRLSGAAFQPAVEFGAGNLAVGVWASTPFDPQVVPDSSDPEFDLYGSYNFAVNDAVSITPGFTAYIFPKAPTSAGFYRANLEPNLAVNYTVSGLKLTPKVYYDFVSKGATFELNAAFALPLKDLGTELDFIGQIGTYKWTDFSNHANPRVKGWGDYWFLGVSAPFQLTKESKLILGFAYTEGRNAFTKQGTFPKSVNTGAIGRGSVSLSYIYAF
eukprot:TRINITY_DN30936_c0_g1_i1.p1 TRINITY_DN30936_c0_g1~~TRINITY_DN30936_c0_g1_i1.p1  ORF type:complete len:267 (-),score=21.49 TRINITY_DN30936_c0_g1_i1:363-1163(-)